jgi:hypothetical protein
MKKGIVFFISMAVAFNLHALDPAFSQFNAASLYYNPGFSGITENPRLVSLYTLVRNIKVPLSSLANQGFHYMQLLFLLIILDLIR